MVSRKAHTDYMYRHEVEGEQAEGMFPTTCIHVRKMISHGTASLWWKFAFGKGGRAGKYGICEMPDGCGYVVGGDV